MSKKSFNMAEFNDYLVQAIRESGESDLKFDERGKPILAVQNEKGEKQAQEYISQFAPKYLYRFRGANQHDIDALRNNQIWASTLKEYNDPYESRYFLDHEKLLADAISRSGFMERWLKNMNIDMDSNNSVAQIIRSEGTKMTESLAKELEYLRSRLFTSCFSESRTSQLMWAHYANSHKGICICYRYEDLISQFGQLNLVPVKYSEHLNRIGSFDEDIYQRDLLSSCVTKSAEWAYEKEWRLIAEYRLNEPYSKGILIDAPVPYAIYLGVSIDADTKKVLMDICKEKSIQLYQMRLSEKKYRLIPFEVNL